MEEAKVHEAIQTILSDMKARKTSLNWAIAYCQAAKGMTGKTLQVQCFYILNNIHHWRHPEARLVRKRLKAFAKNIEEDLHYKGVFYEKN